MAGNGSIKGITIQIGADIQPLDNALKDVNKQAKSLQTELKEVERGLKLDPGNVELVRQKQQLLTQSIEATSDKLHVLRQAQGQVEQQFRNGEIGEEQYRAFRRELVNTENNMRNLQGQFNSLQTEQQRLTETTRSLGAFFDATGTNVEEFASTLGTRLTQAIRNGTASADQMERALRLMGTQALGAGTDINEMRRVLNQINSGSSIDDIRTELQQMNTVVVTTQDELKEIDKLLRFNPNNVELLSQKQALLTRSIQDTSTELQQLQQRQSQVEAQFQSGNMGAEEYRAFQRQIEQTEQSLRGYQNQMSRMEQEQQQVQASTRQLRTLFDATGTSVDQFADVLGNDLTRAIREGRATSAQLEQALDRIGQSSLGSRADLEQMRAALRNLDNGANLDQIRADLDRIADSANQADSEVKGFGDSLSGAIGGLVAGGGIAGIVEKALDTSSLNTKIDITFDVPEESKESIRQAIRDIGTYGIDGEEALEGVRRQWALNKDASDEANASIVEGAGVIAKSYQGIDFIELIQEINEIAAEIEVTNEEALALTNSLLKAGFPPEQLDTIAEYGKQMKMAGFNAAEIQAIFEKGIDTKSWNIDNLNDGVKEAKIVMMEFGLEVPKAVEDLIKGTDLSAKQLQDWGKAVAGGGKEGAQAMADVSAWLRTIEDDALRNEMAIAVFGTKAEDQGDNLISIFEGIVDAQDRTAENQNTLNESIDKLNSDPAVQMKQAFQDMMTALQPLLTMVAEFITKIAEWISENPGFTAAIAAIGSVLGIVVGAFAALMPAISALVSLWPTLVAAFGAISAPIAIVIAGITALIAIGIALWKNWDEVSAFLKECWEGIKNVATTVWTAISDFFVSTWDSIKSAVETMWNGIKDFFTTIWDGIKSVFDTVVGAILTNLTTYWDSMSDGITKVWDGIKQYFTSLWDLIKNVFVGALLVVLQLLTGQWGEAKKSTEQIWDNIKEALSGMWEGIKKVFSGALSAVVGFVKTHWENIKNTTSTVFNAVKSGISTAWNAIKTTVSTIAESIWTTIKSKFTSIATSVSDKMTEVKTSITKLWGEAQKFLEGIDLTEIGKDIIRGLISGIKAMTKKAVEAITGVVDGVINKAKSLLDINSPSGVFMQFGEWTNEGFIEGINDSSKRLQNAVGNVYGSLASSADKSHANQIAQTQIIQQGANIDLNSLVAAITQLAGRPIQTQVNMDGRAVANSVSVHQFGDANLKGFRNGVPL